MILVSLFLLILLLASSLPIAIALAYLGYILNVIYSDFPVQRAVGELAWSTSSDSLLISVPLFILLGELLLRSGIADKMFLAMRHWLSWLPGGIMHANIGASTMFAATSGSSVATSATVGTVALPLVKRYGYNERLFLGSIAAGGTLGILIPPSINLIIYGWLTETSIPTLYLAGIVPGLVLAVLFSMTVLLGCLAWPKLDGRREVVSWPDRIRALPALVPPLLIFALVVGTIYAGIATPSEAASFGVTGALILAAANRQLTLRMLAASIEGTMRTTGMIMLIILGAWFLNFVLSIIGLTDALNAYITDNSWTPNQTLLAIILFYVVVGTVMEPMPMMFITIPVIAPVIEAAGFDLIWFGILIILLCETAMISPPVGANLFVVQGVRGHGSMNDVMIGVMPFVVTLFVMTALIVFFPDIVMWLPDLFAN